QQGEMLRLEKIIRPTIGILTNIGEAHSEGFIDADHKFREKLSLFRNATVLIGREADLAGRQEYIDMLGEELKLLIWGSSGTNDFIIRSIEKLTETTTIAIEYNQEEITIAIPFTDDAAIENAITCSCLLL